MLEEKWQHYAVNNYGRLPIDELIPRSHQIECDPNWEPSSNHWGQWHVITVYLDVTLSSPTQVIVWRRLLVQKEDDIG